MNEKIVPLKTIKVSGDIHYFMMKLSEAREFIEWNDKKRFTVLYNTEKSDSASFFLTAASLFVPVITLFLTHNGYYTLMIFLGTITGGLMATRTLKHRLTQKIKKVLLPQKLQSYLDIINDPLYQEVSVFRDQLRNLNYAIDLQVALIDRIDDFRELTPKESANYEKLRDQRKEMGLKLLKLEEKIKAHENQTTLPAPAAPPTLLPTEQPLVIDRGQLEKEIEALGKQLNQKMKLYDQHFRR